MCYNRLSRIDLLISGLCLDTMTFGGSDGIRQHIGSLQQTDAERLFGRVLDAGINFIGTAGVHANGTAEQLTGQALKNLKVSRDSVVVTTKVSGQTDDNASAHSASRFRIIDGIKASLKRMQLDHIDLYQIHGFDPAAPIEEIVRILDTLTQHGHVCYVDVSNWTTWQIVKTSGIVERPGCARFESLQTYYTAVGRGLERESVPMLKSEGLGLMVWGPLAGGLLSGRYTHEQHGEQDSCHSKFDFLPMDRARAYTCVDVMCAMADARSMSVTQITLVWLLHRQAATTVVVGAKKIEQLDDNTAVTRVELTAEELAQLNELSRLPTEHPG